MASTFLLVLNKTKSLVGTLIFSTKNWFSTSTIWGLQLLIYIFLLISLTLINCFTAFPSSFFIFIISCYKPSPPPLPLIIYTPVQNIAPKNFKILLKKNIDSFAALIYLLTLEKNQAWLAGEVDMGRRHAFKHFNLLTALRDIICKQKKVWNIGKHASQEIRLDIHQKAGLRTWRIWIL